MRSDAPRRVASDGCSEYGTYTVDRARNSLTLTNRATETSTVLPIEERSAMASSQGTPSPQSASLVPSNTGAALTAAPAPPRVEQFRLGSQLM